MKPNNQVLKTNGRRIFISPHLDDAVLSCYPNIIESLRLGTTVEIWTMMAGVPSTKAKFSDFSLQISKPKPVKYVKMRQAEDHAVGKSLGVKTVHFDFPDAIYRNDDQGRPIYHKASDIFGKVDLRELYLINRIFWKLQELLTENDTIICPSAMCGHVDHILTRVACEMLPNQILYYNEFPYNINIQTPLHQKIQDEWAEKIRMYKTQMKLLFSENALQKLLSIHQPELMVLRKNQPVIPRKIHCIWVGNAPIPPAASNNLEAWATLLGEKWEIRLWTNKDLNETNFSSEVLKKIDEAPHGIQKADVLRYQILSKEGGWYFDLDFEPLQSIEPIALMLYNQELILCNEDENLENKTSNGFFACSAGNAAISALAREVLKMPLNTGNFDMLHIVNNTGPAFFDDVVKNAPATRLPDHLFYPVTFSGIINQQNSNPGYSFARHKWHNRYIENRRLYFGIEESPASSGFKIPFLNRTPQIMIFCFVKDEPELMSRWIPYHAKLVGMKNIMIIDHGSKKETKLILNSYTHLGLQIYDAGMFPFTEKSKVLSNLMTRYKHYRLLIPLDADEFICIKTQNGMECNTQTIRKAFRKLPDKPVIFKFGTFDVCNQPQISYLDPLSEMKEFRFFPSDTTEVFSTKAPSKSFFPGKYFVSTDDGNHLGKIEPHEGYFFTNLSIAHFYIRGFGHFLKKHTNADEIIGVTNHEEHIQYSGTCNHWIERMVAIKRGEAANYFESKICSLRGFKEEAISKAFSKIPLWPETLSKYPDVKASGMNPLLHYLLYGKNEGRQQLPKKESNPPQILLQNNQNHLHHLNFDSILIITYGRSGSTLLQGILNSIDGCVIRGENYNAIFHLFEFYEKLNLNKNDNSDQTMPNNPMFGAGLLDEELVLKHLQNMVRDVLLANKRNNPDFFCYGFKEISYIEMPDELFSYLNFLARIFPNVGFIFLTRNIEHVIKSAWWADIDPEKAKADLVKIENLFNEYCQNKPNSFKITYEDIVANGQRLKAMFDFIGAEYSKATIDTILSIPHSYDPSQKPTKRLFLQ